MAGESMSTELSAMAQIPNLLGESRSAAEALQTLADVPSAADATGSCPASAATVALGAGLVEFLVDTVEAIDDDIDAITETRANYQQNEAQVSQPATAGTLALNDFAAA